MKIESCYIENFGTFSGKTLEFQNGLNTILQSNGWGKTTLAAFLKAMLYGMPYSRSAENERKKYMPWGGGRYGGNMTFCVGEKRYRVERFFGKTEKNDTFAIYNLATNLLTEDYTTNLGEELFAVDRESFEKSVFIQVDNPENSLLTDMMSAKMSDVPTDTGDLDRLNDVLVSLEKKATALKAKRGNGGKINDLKSQLAKEKLFLEECQEASKGMEAEKNAILSYEQSDAVYRKRLAQVNQDISAYQFAGCKDEYNRRKKELAECTEKIEEKKKIFNGAIPSAEQLSNAMEMVSEYNIQVALSKENSVSDSDKEKLGIYKEMFCDGVPAEEELLQAEQLIRKLEILNQKNQKSLIDTNDIVRLEQLKDRFANKELTDEEIDRVIAEYEEISEMQRHHDTLVTKGQEREEKQNKDAKKFNSVMLSLFIVAGVVVLIGLALLIFVNTYLGIGIEIGGVLTTIVGRFLIKPAPKQDAAIGALEAEKIREIDSEIQRRKLSYTNFMNTYGRKDGEQSMVKAFADIRKDRDNYLELEAKLTHLNSEHSNVQKEFAAVEQQVEEMLLKFPGCGEYTDYNEALTYLRTSITDYQRICKLVNNHNAAVKIALEKKNAIYQFLENYYTTIERPLEQIRTLSKHFDAYELIREEWEKKQAAFDEFCQQNDINKIENLELPEQSIEMLNQSQQELSGKLVELSKAMAESNQRFANEASVAEKLPMTEAKIASLLKEIAEAEKEYEILLLTEDLLKKAGESLAEKYVSDIERSFKKYMQFFEKENAAFCVDAQLNVSMERNGMRHDKYWFSAGERDLTELCVRLALLEAVYKDTENPVVILDDPFVNLDDKSMELAKQLIEDLAKNYQIIYFSCQESRVG